MVWSPNEVLRNVPALEVAPGEEVEKIALRILNQRSFQPYLQDSCDPIQNLTLMIQNKIQPYVKEQIGKMCSLTSDVPFGLWILPTTSEWDTTVPLCDFGPKGINFAYLMAGRTQNDTLYGVGLGCNFLVWWPQLRRIIRAWKFRYEQHQVVYHGTLYCQIGKATSNGWRFESVRCRCYVDRPPPPEHESINGLFWLDRQIRTRGAHLPDDVEKWGRLREYVVSATPSEKLKQAMATIQFPLATEDFENLCVVAGLSLAETKELRSRWLAWRDTPPRENLVFESLIWLERQAEVDFIGNPYEEPTPRWTLQPRDVRPPERLGSIQLTFDVADKEPMDKTALLTQTVAAYEQIEAMYHWNKVEATALRLQDIYKHFMLR